MAENISIRLRVEDAADYLGVAPATLAKWRIRGFGPRFIKAGVRVLYDRADLDAWLESRKRAHTAEAGR